MKSTKSDYFSFEELSTPCLKSSEAAHSVLKAKKAKLIIINYKF